MDAIDADKIKNDPLLREKLVELNPGLPDVAYDDAVRQITATVASQTLAATNREKHDLIHDGVQVIFRTDDGERVRQRMDLEDAFKAIVYKSLQADREKADITDIVFRAYPSLPSPYYSAQP